MKSIEYFLIVLCSCKVFLFFLLGNCASISSKLHVVHNDVHKRLVCSSKHSINDVMPCMLCMYLHRCARMFSVDVSSDKCCSRTAK